MDDRELLKSCLEGNQQAWAEFILRYSRLIYNYIHSVLAIKGRSDLSDQVQDIFQELFACLIRDNYKKLATFRGKNGCSLASWLRQVTINFTIDYLRRIRPVLSLEAQNNEGFSLNDLLADMSLGAREFIINQDNRKALGECIEKLDLDDQYFLELFMGQGLTLDEIQEHFKVSRGAVDMRKSRILAKLQECFKKKGFLG